MWMGRTFSSSEMLKMNINKLLWLIFKGTLKNVINETLIVTENTLSNADPESISVGKVWLCYEIQRKRHVPGEIRKIACKAVNKVTAKDLVSWVKAVRELVDAW